LLNVRAVVSSPVTSGAAACAAVEQLRNGVPRFDDMLLDVREELSMGRVRVTH